MLLRFGEPAIAVPFNGGKNQSFNRSLREAGTIRLLKRVYDGMLYDAPDHLKSLVNRFVELNNITEPLSSNDPKRIYHHHVG